MARNLTLKQLVHRGNVANGSSALMTSACGVSVLFFFAWTLRHSVS